MCRTQWRACVLLEVEPPQGAKMPGRGDRRFGKHEGGVVPCAARAKTRRQHGLFESAPELEARLPL